MMPFGCVQLRIECWIYKLKTSCFVLKHQDFSVGKLRRERNKKAKKLATVIDLLEPTLKVSEQFNPCHLVERNLTCFTSGRGSRRVL